MTNRLELNWKLDGFVDEQRYYCSEAPIDPENLPTPKVILAGDVRTYMDTDIEADKTYFVAIGSVKNNVEKLGDIVTIDTVIGDPYWANVTSLLRFNGANNSNVFTDERGLVWDRVGTPYISTTQSKFGGASGKFADNSFVRSTLSANVSAYTFSSSEDFTVDVWVYIPTGASIYGGGIPIICVGVQDITSSGGGWNLLLINDAVGKIRLERDGTNNTLQEARFSIGSAIPRDVWMHIEFGRSGGTTYGFFNGNLIGTSTSHNNIPFNTPNVQRVVLGGGDGISTQNIYHLDGYLDDLRITKGICRHTSSFTPPVREAQNF